MKVLSMEEAQVRFPAICREALAGEVIRLKLADGALLELMPVPSAPTAQPLSQQQLQECYNDTEWADFENNCGKASD